MINTNLAQFCMAFNQAFGGPFGNAILSSDNKTLHITVGGVTRQFDENLQLVIDASIQKPAYGVTCGSPEVSSAGRVLWSDRSSEVGILPGGSPERGNSVGLDSNRIQQLIANYRGGT
jgi:hypothetical protein